MGIRRVALYARVSSREGRQEAENGIIVGNAGGQPLEIGSARLCGAAASSLAIFEPQAFPCQVAPGRALAIGMVFSGWPNTGERTLTGTLVLSSNDPLNPVVRIPLCFRAGLAESPLQPAASLVKFAVQLRKASVSADWPIYNGSAVRLRIASTRFLGKGAARFSCGSIGLSLPPAIHIRSRSRRIPWLQAPPARLSQLISRMFRV